MNLHDKVSVSTHYTRSVNLERDSESVDVVAAYIPTSRAIRTFERITEAFGDESLPRAWSLIGPYGSGKSSFSVFLSQLFSNPEDEGAKVSQNILRNVDVQLADLYLAETDNSNGYFKILITGSPEPLSQRLMQGIASAAENYWKNLKGRNPKIIEELKKATSRDVSTSDVINFVKLVQSQLQTTNCKGMLIVIDELGKFLEFEARHYGANEIYLLQVLAEHACQGHKVNLLLFVLLHQSFEQYAKGLGENLKNEWSKVQGRFEEVPFLESAEQVLRVVSAAFSYNLNNADSKKIRENTEQNVRVLIEQDVLPSTLKFDEAVGLFTHCYPLHPVSAVILPLLCQKVAQNERTLFSYLGSHEDFGLQHMLGQMKHVKEYVYPHQIFDYFITNQPAVLGDYLTHRRWAEVVTAIERLGDASEDEVNTLKTIGILNIIGSKGGLKASKALLEICSENKSMIGGSLKALQDKSIINFRRFGGDYRVWQGSDFDLEDALQEELNNLGQFSLSEELNATQSLVPIVARKYTIQNGALRYFGSQFVDANNYHRLAKRSENPRIIFYLAADQDDEKIFISDVIRYFSEIDIVALILNGDQLREAVAESLALKRVRTSRQELNSDPVAKREFEDRFAAAADSETKLLRNLIDAPKENRWYFCGEESKVNNKRAMQEYLSHVLQQVYSKSPRIFNELINRDKPSSQANAARNKLLSLMQVNSEKEDLDIDKFPAEKAIYRAVLRQTGLHQYQKGKGIWQFSPPPVDGRKDRANLRHVWKRIDDFLDDTKKEAKSLALLNKELMSPPFGVKAGLLPVLYITFYLVKKHELAVYEQGRYKPYFTEDMLERFVKRPDEFEFQRFRITGLRASIFEQYSKVIHGDNKQRTLLELAKPLASFMGGLPEYTLKTRSGVSEKAVNVRNAFNLAKSPERLLFEEIPQAIGFGDIRSTQSAERMEEFSHVLIEVLRELKNAHDTLLSNQKALLAQAFNVDPNLPLIDIRKILSGNCYGLENYTVDTQGAKALITRITKSSGSEDEWLENILMYLGNKPTSKWQDSDRDTAEYRLTDCSRRIIDLEKLRLHDKDRAKGFDGDFDVYLLRSIKKGGAIQDEVVAVDKESTKQISHTKEKIRLALGELIDKELMLGALAEVVDDFLIEYKGHKSNSGEQFGLQEARLAGGEDK